MISRPPRLRILLSLAVLGLVTGLLRAAPAKAPLAGERVLWMGDSITQAGGYVTFVEYYLETAFPKEKFDIVSIGRSGETVSGLSEATHPFPRPCAHDRLPRALELVKPTVVFACYGMNDGIYHPPSPERQQAFETGMTKLIATCRAAGARVLLLTPPPFDPVPPGRNLQPLNAPVFGYSTPYEGYDAVLAAFARWAMARSALTAPTIDLHTGVNAYLARRRQTAPDFTFAKDGVHPNDAGHLLMAQLIVRALGVPLPKTADDLEAELARIQLDPLYPLLKKRRETRSAAWLARVGLPGALEAVEADCAKLQVQIDDLRAMGSADTTTVREIVPPVREPGLGISGPGAVHTARWAQMNRDLPGSAVQRGLIPDLKPLLPDTQLRDTVVIVGGDGNYYLTGSSGNDIWDHNTGVELWRSADLKTWDYLGLVWTFEKDATWQKAWRWHHKPVRALWAPELHYIKRLKNYFITLSMPPGDRGLLRSTTGKPEGPYVNALAADGKWPGDIDASLFEDDDGTVYLVSGGGWIARLNDDLSGLAEAPRKPELLHPDLDPRHHAENCPTRRNCADVGHEGAYLFKKDGKYYLTAADTYEGRYSSMVAISDHLYGPYDRRHEAVPTGGGTDYFRDKEGNWWCAYFGNDDQAPFREKPAIVRVDFGAEGLIHVAKPQPDFVLQESARNGNSPWSVAPAGAVRP